MGYPHREGRLFLRKAGIVLVLANVPFYAFFSLQQWYLAGSASLLFYLFCMQFFRNPSVDTPLSEGTVYAPADGKVVQMCERYEGEFLKKRCLQVSIFMSPLNAHVNRVPVRSVVDYFEYHPGRYLFAWLPKSSLKNERTTWALRATDDTIILMRQIAGFLARRIRWYVKEGDSLQEGQELGFIKFGSRVDMFLPLDVECLVKEGDKVRGGRTPVAQLFNKEEEAPSA